MAERKKEPGNSRPPKRKSPADNRNSDSNGSNRNESRPIAEAQHTNSNKMSYKDSLSRENPENLAPSTDSADNYLERTSEDSKDLDNNTHYSIATIHDRIFREATMTIQLHFYLQLMLESEMNVKPDLLTVRVGGLHKGYEFKVEAITSSHLYSMIPVNYLHYGKDFQFHIILNKPQGYWSAFYSIVNVFGTFSSSSRRDGRQNIASGTLKVPFSSVSESEYEERHQFVTKDISIEGIVAYFLFLCDKSRSKNDLKYVAEAFLPVVSSPDICQDLLANLNIDNQLIWAKPNFSLLVLICIGVSGISLSINFDERFPSNDILKQLTTEDSFVLRQHFSQCFSKGLDELLIHSFKYFKNDLMWLKMIELEIFSNEIIDRILKVTNQLTPIPQELEEIYIPILAKLTLDQERMKLLIPLYKLFPSKHLVISNFINSNRRKFSAESFQRGFKNFLQSMSMNLKELSLIVQWLRDLLPKRDDSIVALLKDIFCNVLSQQSLVVIQNIEGAVWDAIYTDEEMVIFWFNTIIAQDHDVALSKILATELVLRIERSKRISELCKSWVSYIFNKTFKSLSDKEQVVSMTKYILKAQTTFAEGIKRHSPNLNAETLRSDIMTEINKFLPSTISEKLWIDMIAVLEDILAVFNIEEISPLANILYNKIEQSLRLELRLANLNAVDQQWIFDKVNFQPKFEGAFYKRVISLYFEIVMFPVTNGANYHDKIEFLLAYTPILACITSVKYTAIYKVAQEHTGFRMTRDLAEALLESIQQKSISIKDFNLIAKNRQTDWQGSLSQLSEILGNSRVERSFLKECLNAIKLFKESLACIKAFLSYCLSIVAGFETGSKSLQSFEYLEKQCLAIESNIGNLTLAQIGDLSSVLGDLKNILNHAELHRSIYTSKLYISTWNQTFKEAIDKIYVSERSLTEIHDLFDDQPKIEMIDSIFTCASDETDRLLSEFFLAFNDVASVKFNYARKFWSSEMDFDNEIDALEKSKFSQKIIYFRGAGQVLRHLSRAFHYCQNVAPAFLKVCEIFNVHGTAESELFDIATKLANFDFKSETSELKLLSDYIEDWERKLSSSKGAKRMKRLPILTELVEELLLQLSYFKEILDFLNEIKTEKNFNIIDMVEENSESIIRAETVSNFDSVRRFLHPIIIKGSLSVESLLIELFSLAQGIIDETTHQYDMIQRLESSRAHIHGIKSIWYSVAKREESTKASCFKILKNGQVTWTRTDSLKFALSVSYKSEDFLETKDRSSIEELRSRALLLINSSSKLVIPNFIDENGNISSSDDRENLKSYIDIVANIMSISSHLEELVELGHFNYQSPLFKLDFTLNATRELMDKAIGDIETWKEVLYQSRKKYRYVNFFYSTQLWILNAYFSNELILLTAGDQLKEMPFPLPNDFGVESNHSCKNSEANIDMIIQNLLRFVKFDLNISEVTAFKNYYVTCPQIAQQLNAEQSDAGKLKALCITLEHMFSHDSISEENKAKFEPVSYVKYKADADLIPLLLSLYPDGNLHRHQLLICDENTSREEIIMFLYRVFGTIKYRTSSVYCILQLHKLSHNYKQEAFHILTTVLMTRHEDDCNSLVFLFCEDSTQYVEGLKIPRLQLIPKSEKLIKTLFQSRAPKLCALKSHAAGMGKTEYCRTYAHNEGLQLRTMLLVDGISRLELLQEVQNLHLSDHQCLHIDIANLVNEAEVDLGLFELLFLGTGQIGRLVVHWPSYLLCFVEIPSSSEVNSNHFQTLKYCNCKTLTWSTDKLEIPDDPLSDIQLVCSYLKYLESNQIHKADLVFPGLIEHDCRKVNTEVLNQSECCKLFTFYFESRVQNADALSLNVFWIFCKVLAEQLRRFTTSGHYQIDSLIFSGTNVNIRTTVVQNMVDCAREFATRSVVHVRSRQNREKLANANKSIDLGEIDNSLGLLKWEENNQYMACIAQDAFTLVYRKLSEVNNDIVVWYNNQAGAKNHLKDYYEMDAEELRKRLSIFCGLENVYMEDAGYVLTSDNFLKAVMMLLRVQANIPVIVMGEAGCGKTSLIRFIARMSNASLLVISIHAGVTRDILTKLIAEGIADHQEDSKPLWIFLDEINTCNELGFINSLICHRELPGIRIPRRVSFFAACNPYRNKKMNSCVDAFDVPGLQKGSGDVKGDGLVYRVKPLPETMLDYIWDFGSLSSKDEKSYINQYLGQLVAILPNYKKTIDALIHLVAESQIFMRELYSDNSVVSMRDVRRVKTLFPWFVKHKLPRSALYNADVISEIEEPYECIILTLAHCYRCRLSRIHDRKRYDQRIVANFEKLQIRIYTRTNKRFINARDIINCIKSEQQGYLQMMKIPSGIARNESLRENVFVLLVCILNKIPVFLVGKPGSSKTLSISLLISNLRGLDSDSVFFKRLPEIKMISFQGSESSTSDGILKIFARAEGFSSAEGDSLQVVPVVLIDEIGLAEISPFNPLKVLHSKLETHDDSPLKVAVVGISNWTLDLSKMSRGVYLSRPDPSSQELQDTAVSIVEAIHEFVPSKVRELLRNLSDEYLKFCSNKTFHGLRDFYSVCKYIGRMLMKNKTLDSTDIVMALMRNFNGSQERLEDSIFKSYFDRLVLDNILRDHATIPNVVDLVVDNLTDKEARHLMVISEGDSILNVFGQFFSAANLNNYRIIVGSKFKGDQSENYRYRMLSEIILSMERGESLVLRDLDGIYGSLYDMLNQNYTIVAGKRNCRVALGAYSNPMAFVHDDFKCVVLVETEKVKLLDPPFLNRFEKQTVNFEKLLSEVLVMKYLVLVFK